MSVFEDPQIAVGRLPDRPITVGIVLEIFFPTVNGVITSSLNLAQNLIARGHRVVFFAPRWKQYHEPVVHGIPVHYIYSTEAFVYPGMRNVLPWTRQVPVLLQRERIDVVHITGPYLLTWAFVRSAQRLGIPIVHTFHTMLYDKRYIRYFTKTSLLVPVFRAFSRQYFSLFIRRSTIMTGPSRMVCEYLRANYIFADVRHITNGVDVSQFGRYASLSEVQQRVPQWNHKSFLFVGRIGPEKSVDQLVVAMAHARRADPDIRLFIVGDGPGRRDYEQLARRIRVTDNVFFLGRIKHEDLLHSGLIHHARGFVTASTTETQGISVIEAICCQVPIIIPNVAGIIELLDGNGISFPADNRRALAEAIVRMANDDRLHAEFRANSEGLSGRYDGRWVTEQFLGVYAEALARTTET